MKLYRKNEFTKEDLDFIEKMLNDESLSREYRQAILSLLKAYAKDLYCSDCQGSKRVSSRSGICQWCQDMSITLEFNKGPIEWYPKNCPIRKLLR